MSFLLDIFNRLNFEFENWEILTSKVELVECDLLSRNKYTVAGDRLLNPKYVSRDYLRTTHV
jgi:hypothetical protein